MKNSYISTGLLVMGLAAGLVAQQKDFSVRIHQLGDPDKLNPLTSTSAGATEIEQQLFVQLLRQHPQTLEWEPYGAVSRPEVKVLKEGKYAGGMSLTYEIRPQAVWDTGDPITAADYIFTIKALKNPKVNAAPIRPYYNFVDDIVVDADNPKRFTVYSKEVYFLAEEATGMLLILPEYYYDPERLMRKVEIPVLHRTAWDSETEDVLQTFADGFHSPEYEREAGYIVGGGPYELLEWKTGEQIVLQQKKMWWGFEVGLESYADQLIYRFINDTQTAIALLQKGEIDLMTDVKPKDFVEMEADPVWAKKFDFYTQQQPAYYYIGFNMRDKRLAELNVRQALAHLADRYLAIETLFGGMAQVVNTPINPIKEYHNKGLPDMAYDIERAKQLLAEGGWKDSDGDGILDKKIGGKKESLSFTYKYNQGNTVRKELGLSLQAEARRVGIDIQIVVREWTVLLDDLEKRDFELVAMAWVQGTGLDDLRQIWHSDSDTPDGSNRVGFRNERADALMEEIAKTLDEGKRLELYMELQQIIASEQPYIFLVSPQARLVVSNRFEVNTTAIRPYYSPHLIRLKQK